MSMLGRGSLRAAAKYGGMPAAAHRRGERQTVRFGVLEREEAAVH